MMKSALGLFVCLAYVALALGQDSSHWCCGSPIKPVEKLISNQKPREVSRSVSELVKEGEEKCNEDDEWWEPWCPKYVTKYRLKFAYRMDTEYQMVVSPGVCQDPICCEGFVLFAKQCMRPKDVEMYKKLIERGLIDV
ncbi:unnamed protein product [Owenia fusiformis]|uniref:Uncharacterized protein n=1 Tax=Owenia fusiformis TaxID=6347 RepID=A0A8S4N339_OWEFU|nr:unnamed protein product [Owenia fusiformis]